MAYRSPESPGSSERRASGAWLAVAALLAVGIVVPLLVGLYDSETPAVLGFPFFYWFQFLLIPIVSVMTFVAFKISLRAEERDRQRFGLPTHPEDREGERR